MDICPNGHPLVEGAQYCPQCGVPVHSAGAGPVDAWWESGQSVSSTPPPPSYPPSAYPPPPGYPPQGFPAPAFQPQGYPALPNRATNGLSVASLVLGILWIWGLGALLALIFGLVARKQIRERNQSGGGMATAGIVLGTVGLLGAILLTSVIATRGPTLASKFDARASCISRFATVETSVQAYRAQTGRYPTSISQLEVTTTGPDGATVGPWLTGSVVDAGHYQIAVSPDGSGAVGVFTTGADPAQISSSDTSAACLYVP